MGMVTMERVRDWEPEAQETEQVLHADQKDILQSTGHSKLLQVASLERAPQGKPPWATLTMMDLVLVFEPLLQDLEQAPKPDHLERTQLTGQPKVLQEADLLSSGHTTPPCCTSTITERVVVLEPVPQDLVQTPQVFQPETAQFTGHAKVLQEVVEIWAAHSAPP
jgi:hypothetical protein